MKPTLAAALALALLPFPAMSQMTQEDHMAHMATEMGITEPGQSAFGAIAQIVARLESDPATDWSRVNIPALRAHLIDMDLVTLHAKVAVQPTNDGATFTVTGTPEVASAIRRMTKAHAAMMQGAWTYNVTDIDGGVIMTVTTPQSDRAKLLGLGFIGIMASGMHHQMHHWMMATGADPH